MGPIRLYPILAFLLLTACAQVAELSGGEKDTEPPYLVDAQPAHSSTGFTGDRITLTFNERIQLDRVRERLLISPPLTSPPIVRLAGPRTVVIDLNAPLRENTTYSFRIGEAVKDLTEGNAATNVAHVISTGSFVDSLMIAGRVVNAFSGVPEKDVLVMAYSVADTGSIRTSRPTYATRTGVRGEFLLDHLREGSYELFALRDQNANYMFDLPNEEIAFLDTLVLATVPDTLVPIHELFLFQEVSEEQRIREARVIADGAFQIVLERRAETVRVRDIARTGGSLEWLPEWSTKRDTLLLWPSDTTLLNAGRYQIATEDGILDTLRYRRTEKMPFHTKVQVGLQETSDGPLIRLKTSRPIAGHDTARMQLLLDSIPLPFLAEADTAHPRTLLLKAAIDPGARVTLHILPQGITDIYGGYNDTVATGLGRAAEKSTGTLRLSIDIQENTEGPFLLHLLDRQGSVVQERSFVEKNSTFVWQGLTPGEFTIRLIHDRNGNGRWDPGRLVERTLPEHVWRHEERVNVRAAWDLGVEWNIGEHAEEEDEEEESEP